jgi:hypothetical protein
MEFYIKMLQMLVLPGHAFFNILGGKKTMLAAQVRLQSNHAIQCSIFERAHNSNINVLVLCIYSENLYEINCNTL